MPKEAKGKAAKTAGSSTTKATAHLFECYCPKCDKGTQGGPRFTKVSKSTFYIHKKKWKEALAEKGIYSLPSRTQLSRPLPQRKEDDIHYFASSQDDLLDPNPPKDSAARDESSDDEEMGAGPSGQMDYGPPEHDHGAGSDMEHERSLEAGPSGQMGYELPEHDHGAGSDMDHERSSQDGIDHDNEPGERRYNDEEDSEKEEGDHNGDDREEEEQDIELPRDLSAEGDDPGSDQDNEPPPGPQDHAQARALGTGLVGPDDDERELELQDNDDLTDIASASSMNAARMTWAYVQAIKEATLDKDQISLTVLQRLRNPIREELDLTDPETRFAFKLLLATTDGSEKQYTLIRNAHMESFPESHLMTHAQVENKLTEISGLEPILYDMCLNSCMAYSGPQAGKDHCPECGHPRYYPASRKPYQQFQTYPIGPMLQTMYRNPETAKLLQYRVNCTRASMAQASANKAAGRPELPDVLKDIFDGENYLRSVRKGKITDNSVTLMLSIDGAQLYRHKKSDFWIFIWVILDFPPEVRYRKDKVLIAAIVPGPEAPKDHDSFLFPSLHHLAAIQKEGLLVWDASKDKVETKDPNLNCTCADGPGIVHLNGQNGHKGYISCRLWCPACGRRKPKTSRYYPVHLKPDNYDVAGCTHPDIDLTALKLRTEKEYIESLRQLMAARNNNDYAAIRMRTGLTKPSILFSIPHRQEITRLFAIDIMHLFCLNIPDLMIALLRGGSNTFKCDPRDDVSTWTWAVLRDDNVWNAYGKQVEQATPYLPGSFGRVPGNIAAKINSGYKACQHSLHLYGIAPVLLLNRLSRQFHRHICKLVRLVQILSQKEDGIPQEDIVVSDTLASQWVLGYETMYVQRKPERIHFCRPCIHTLAHCPLQTRYCGPLACVSQWTTERTIGNITAEVKQPSNPMANLAERSKRRNQINALVAMDPLLSHKRSNPYPKGSRPLQGEYVLLQRRERTKKHVTDLAARKVIHQFLGKPESENPKMNVKIRKWGRLCLPNGQIARSLYKESTMKTVRRARNVKFVHGRSAEVAFGEVQYYFRYLNKNGQESAAALISMYSDPMLKELEDSHGVVHICQYRGEDTYAVIDVKAIKSVVAMVPFPGYEHRNFFYKVEKIGLGVDKMAGVCYYDRN